LVNVKHLQIEIKMWLFPLCWLKRPTPGIIIFRAIPKL
jgi:hypothetical protein